MVRLFVFILAMASGVVFADTELSQDEILGVLKKLTDKKTTTWISSGVISADHLEYRSPKMADANEIELEVVKAVSDHVKKDKSSESLEVVPFNTRYRLGNSYEMLSKESVRLNEDKFYWQIEVVSRTDSIKPGPLEKSNHLTEYFQMGWNKLRVFAWDGDKYIQYFRPGNQAIITANPKEAKGPLSVGCIPWGIGKWSYEELQKCQLSASRSDKDEIILNIVDDIFSMVIILNELQDYTVQKFERRIKLSGIVTSYDYGDYKKLSGGWVPGTVHVSEFDNQRLLSSHLWSDITVNETALSADDFVVTYDHNALIEDFRFGSEPLQYRFGPAMEPEAMKIDTQDIVTKKMEYLVQNSELETNCALASVWFSCKNMGKDMSVKDISGLLPIVKGQSSLADMINVFKAIDGVNINAVKSNLSDIAKLEDSQIILYLPAQKHFVNMLGVDGDKVHIADIDSKKFSYSISRSKLEKIWDGVALLVSDSTAIFERQFAKLSPGESTAIMGAEATCQPCGEIVYQGNPNELKCSDLSGMGYCAGLLYITYTRYGCGGEGELIECREEGMITKVEVDCGIDIDNECDALDVTAVLGWVEACS